MSRRIVYIIAVCLATSVMMACCSAKKHVESVAAVTQASSMYDSVGESMRTGTINEWWSVPVIREGVKVIDTIRHRVHFSDTVRSRVEVSDTASRQLLTESVLAKIPENRKGLAETIRPKTGNESSIGVWLLLSGGVNILFILVIFTVLFLRKRNS